MQRQIGEPKAPHFHVCHHAVLLEIAAKRRILGSVVPVYVSLSLTLCVNCLTLCVNRHMCHPTMTLDIEVSYAQGVVLDEVSTFFHDVTHQLGEDLVGRVGLADFHAQE